MYYEVWAQSLTVKGRPHLRYRGMDLWAAVSTFRQYLTGSAGWFGPLFCYGTQLQNCRVVREWSTTVWEKVVLYARLHDVEIKKPGQGRFQRKEKYMPTEPFNPESLEKMLRTMQLVNDTCKNIDDMNMIAGFLEWAVEAIEMTPMNSEAKRFIDLLLQILPESGAEYQPVAK